MEKKKRTIKENTKSKKTEQKETKKSNTEKKQLTVESIKILVCIIFSIYACFICYKTYNLKLKNDNSTKCINDTSTIDPAIDKETYETLISYIPYYPFTTGIYKDAYNGTKITEEDIEDTLIATSIFGRYQESYTSKNGNTGDIVNLLKANNLNEKEVVYYKSDINNYLAKRYNINLSMLNKLSANIINLNKNYLTVNIKSTFLPKRNKLTINYVAYKEKEDIIILEKTIFYETDTTAKKYYIYTNSNINDNQSPLKTYNLTDESGNAINISEAITKDADEYKEMFKHTFKKNDTGYYWYSTEIAS